MSRECATMYFFYLFLPFFPFSFEKAESAFFARPFPSFSVRKLRPPSITIGSLLASTSFLSLPGARYIVRSDATGRSRIKTVIYAGAHERVTRALPSGRISKCARRGKADRTRLCVCARACMHACMHAYECVRGLGNSRKNNICRVRESSAPR